MSIHFFGRTQVYGCPICGATPRFYKKDTWRHEYVLFCHRWFHKEHIVVDTQTNDEKLAIDIWNDAVDNFWEEGEIKNGTCRAKKNGEKDQTPSKH